MLAGSLGIFNDRGGETPPPPLEPIDNATGRGGSNLPDGDREFTPRRRESTSSNVSSMPDLASVSDSSEEEEEEEEDSESESYAGPTAATVDNYRSVAPRGQVILGLGLAQAHELPSSHEPLAALPEDEPQAQSHLSIDDEVVQESVGGDVAEPEEPSSFVTDGRGRVVWTSPGDRSPDACDLSAPPSPVRSPPPAKTGFTTDGRGRVISVGTEEGTGEEGTSALTPESRPRTSGGQSLFGRMLGAFF